MWVLYRTTESLRFYLAVVMAYGRNGYEHAGIRFVGGQPPKFNNGDVASVEVAFVVGVVPLIVSVLGAVYTACALKQAFETRRRTPPPASPR